MSKRRGRHALMDEQGDWSTARISFVATGSFTLVMIAADTFMDVELPTEAYALLGGLLTGLIAWAGGRAVARYVGPQIAGVAQGFASMAKARREDIEKLRSAYPDAPTKPEDK